MKVPKIERYHMLAKNVAHVITCVHICHHLCAHMHHRSSLVCTQVISKKCRQFWSTYSV